MSIPEIIEQLRDKGWEDADIGEVMGVDRSTVYYWRTKHRTPQAEPVIKDALLRLLKRVGPPRRQYVRVNRARQPSLR
jgi:Homeodomain-like domain